MAPLSGPWRNAQRSPLPCLLEEVGLELDLQDIGSLDERKEERSAEQHHRGPQIPGKQRRSGSKIEAKFCTTYSGCMHEARVPRQTTFWKVARGEVV